MFRCPTDAESGRMIAPIFVYPMWSSPVEDWGRVLPLFNPCAAFLSARDESLLSACREEATALASTRRLRDEPSTSWNNLNEFDTWP